MKKFMSFLLVFLLLSGSCYAGQGLSDLTTVEDQNTDEVIATVVQNVYASTQDDFNKEIALFTMALTNIIANIGDEYSDQAALDFDNDCDRELKKATVQINNISKKSSKNYYDGLSHAGIFYGIGVTDPVASKLEVDVNSIENNMINEMRASVAILKSKDPLPSIGADIKAAVDTFQQIAQQEYSASQAKAMDVPKTTWWTDLKDSGTQFLGIVQVDLEAQCEIEVDKASDKLVKDLKKDAKKQGKDYAKSLVTPSKDTAKK